MAAAHEDFVPRPFENLAGEPDWVALREIVPAATATVHTTPEHGDAEITVATLLPGLWPAWHRADGQIMVGLQTRFSSGDASRDVAQALLAALAAEPDTAIETIDVDAPGPRLQDILVDEPLQVAVLDGFDYWLDPDADRAEQLSSAAQQANESVEAAAAVPGLANAYWCQLGRRAYLRWAMAVAEDDFLDALARLHAKRESAVVPGAKYAGAFRACGIVIPVWELPDIAPDELAEPGQQLRTRLDAALELAGQPLSVDERRARAGLVARQVTLR